MAFFTADTNFYGKTSPRELLEEFGSPLYVYNESLFRERCREMKGLVKHARFTPSFSIKANSNLHLVRIAREEGLHADAMSPGEIYILEKAGFKPDEIFYIGNNVSAEEMRFAIGRQILTSVDSLSQLEMFGALNKGGSVAVRLNAGVGAGHHEKVITAGSKTKFGIDAAKIDEVKDTLARYDLKLAGINQHIGSLFMQPEPYLEAASALLALAEQFDDIGFVDFGGGFGIPYHKQDGEQRLDLKVLGEKLAEIIESWSNENNKNIEYKTEPGRYICAEAGILLGKVYSLKESSGVKYAGTDIGFNTLVRPVMYGSYHDIEVYKNGFPADDKDREPVTVVGNICESGDILAKDRLLAHVEENDILGIMDAGAYGYSMSSNYNSRQRPAEVLITAEGNTRLIRRGDTLEDLTRNF
ncbi:MAG: diaminopimelate decarboxylase [Eubacteriales bacterium]|nr:diaminopimelate decarboxylase [Eubacteriales bacterium]